MNKHIALLRGINVSGKNKVPMPELRLAFQSLGFSDATTYINSGNVVFSSDAADKATLITMIEAAIEERFGLDIPVTVIPAKELVAVVENVPNWWGTDDRAIYDNTIFVIAPTTVREVFQEIGEPKDDIERVGCYGDVIFWSAERKRFNKARWSTIASSAVNRSVTIRTANTVRKLVAIAEALPG